MHGEASAPETLLLGHDHYVRYCGRIQEYLRPSAGGFPSPEEWKVSIAQSPLFAGVQTLESLLFSKTGQPRYSWVDLFLTRDLHIVGLGLHFSEIIIWWLLTVRARREEQESYAVEGTVRPERRAIWYECGPDPEVEAYVDRKEVAEALGVQTKYFRTKTGDYAVAYQEMLLELESDLSA